MKLTKWFKVNGSDQEFHHLDGGRTRAELQEAIDFIVKPQGDLYRVTTDKLGGELYYTLWDARP